MSSSATSDPADAPLEGDEPFTDEEPATRDETGQDDADRNKVDEASAESFPGSDPPSSWAGADSADA
jgi:hypothetical protein